MDLDCTPRHVALGVHMRVPDAPRRNAVEELDAADLDDAVALEGVEPRGLGIEHDRAHASL
jgi:hypothetical protein